MASPVRRPADPLSDYLAAAPAGFYQTARLYLARPGGRPHDPEQRLRFAADLAHHFPGREVSGIESDPADPRRVLLRTPNYAIAGPLGPLPESFVEWLRDQEREGQGAALRFLDLFNHRLNLLRYRLKESRAPGLNNLAPARSRLGQALAALAGHPERDAALPQRSWLGIAGLLAARRKSGGGLAAAVSRYLGAPARLISLVGAWRDIEPRDRMQLGRRNHALGRSAVLGSRVWDQTARVRLVIGPLDHADLLALLPARPGCPAQRPHLGLVALVRMLLDRRLDCEIRLEARAASVPATRLRAAPHDPAAPRLAQTAWLARPRQEDAPAAEFLIPAFEEAAP